jgi:inner membrane protein YidH
MTQASDLKAVSVPDQGKLALERTYLAYERTLMAWIRTATSLITFGFGLYKFVFYLHEQEQVQPAEHLFGARTYGLIMIGMGVLILALATLQHWQMMKRLRAQYPDAPVSLSLVLAALIASLGILAFVAAMFRQ